MQEFHLSGSGPEGVVILDAEDAKIDEVYRVTGWSAETDKMTGVTELEGNSVHTAMRTETTKILQYSKLIGEKSLMDVLKDSRQTQPNPTPPHVYHQFILGTVV